MKRARPTPQPGRRQAFSPIVDPGFALALAFSAGLVAAGELDPAARASGAGTQDAAPAATPDHVSEPAGASTNYEIRWYTISAGGAAATSSAGDFQLRGSVGQPSASADHPAASNSYSHRGGFWVLLVTRGRAVADRVFRDRFE